MPHVAIMSVFEFKMWFEDLKKITTEFHIRIVNGGSSVHGYTFQTMVKQLPPNVHVTYNTVK